MLRRVHHLDAIRRLLAEFPVAAILGPRQVGKTTLARLIVEEWAGESTWLDLEHPQDLARLGRSKASDAQTTHFF